MKNLKSFLNKELYREDFFEVVRIIDKENLTLEVKEMDYRNLYLTGFGNKEYECKITLNPLHAFAKGASVEEFNKCFKDKDFIGLDRFVSDFWISATYRSKNKEIKYTSPHHVENGSYVKLQEFASLQPWKMKYSDLIRYFIQNKISIIDYEYEYGVRNIRLRLGGFNHHSYRLDWILQLKKDVVSNISNMLEVNRILVTSEFEALEDYVNNFYFDGYADIKEGRRSFPQDTHVYCKYSNLLSPFGEDDREIWPDEDGTISVLNVKNAFSIRRRVECPAFSKLMEIISNNNFEVDFSSYDKMKNCVVLELSGFTDSSRGAVYVFLNDDVLIDDAYDYMLNKEYYLLDDSIKLAYVFGYNSHAIINYNFFNIPKETVEEAFR